MRTFAVATALCAALLVLAGCETAPAPQPAKTVAKPAPKPAATTAQAPAPTPAPSPVIPALNTHASETVTLPDAPIVHPKLSPEAAALVDRLTNPSEEGSQQHELSDTTSFPSAMKSLHPGAVAPHVENIGDASSQPPPSGLTADGNSTYLVERDWTGLVLIPVSKSVSRAYTSGVRLTKTEAHPLTDGRVRIWIRIQNLTTQPLPAEIACEFRLRGVHLSSPYFYDLSVPGSGFRDVFFVSPEGELNSYSVLARDADSVQH